MQVPQSFWHQTYRILIMHYFDAAKMPAEPDLLNMPLMADCCEVYIDKIITKHRCNYHNIDLHVPGPYEFIPGAFGFITSIRLPVSDGREL